MSGLHWQVLSDAVQAQLQRLSDFVCQAAASLGQAGRALPASLLNAPAKHLRNTAALLQTSSGRHLTGEHLPVVHQLSLLLHGCPVHRRDPSSCRADLLHDFYTEQMEHFRACFGDGPDAETSAEVRTVAVPMHNILCFTSYFQLPQSARNCQEIA